MAAMEPCTLLVGMDDHLSNSKTLKERLEKGTIAQKISALKEMILLQLHGESQSKLIMSVVKYVQPIGTTMTTNESNESGAHTLKKLVLYFWEVIEKTDSQGKLHPELILLVDFLRRDLTHPNEFIRGATLRFLCHLKEKEILEPLAPTVLECLSDRHSYVRRNAVVSVTNIYKRVPDALPDAPETVENLLLSETDVTTKRNAFLMLHQCTPDRSVNYLRTLMENPEEIQSQSDLFQLAIVDLLKQLMQTNPHDKSEYIKVIFTLLQSESQAVLFQCAATLLSLSSSPTAIKASATTFVQLLNAHCDNNVKLVVLCKLEDIKQKYPETLQELTMDLLYCLVGAESELQTRILDLSLDLVTAKNVEKVIQFLKKELVENSGSTTKGETKYRELLIKFIHTTTVKFRNMASIIVPILMDFIMEDSKPAVDTIMFLREIVSRQPELREDILTKLTIQFNQITASRVFRIALWVLTTHAKTYEEILNIIQTLRGGLDPLPLWLKNDVVDPDSQPDEVTVGGGATVAEDGTYVMAVVPEREEKPETTSFRSLITEADFFLVGVLASSLLKLVGTCYSLKIASKDKEVVKKIATEIVDELIRLGVHKNIERDSHERLWMCQKLINIPHHPLTQKYASLMLKGYDNMIAEEDAVSKEQESKEEKFVPVDDPIQFTQLAKSRRAPGGDMLSLEDVNVAAMNEVLQNKEKVKSVLQLTGFSDPVYVEGTVEVHQFDILLEMLVINTTDDTLQNLTVELGTVGDLRLCERPQSYTVTPGEEVIIRANMKVSSTEAGVIFGNIVYDSSKPGVDQTVIVLNDLHIDIIDYVHPSTCTATAFRTMWQDFEWENRLIVQTDFKTLREYLDHILKHTNMKCQSTSTSLAGEADFLSANLLAKSSFGEPVVANISISKQPNGNIEGYVRIRSRTQGIALGLGDKITLKQKGRE